MYSKRSAQLKKLNAHKSKLEKDYMELLNKISYTNENKKLQQKIAATSNEVEDYQNKHQRLYSMSHEHESQLKHYYNEIKSRAYVTTEDTHDDIQHKAKKNIEFIKKIQDYIKLELDQAQKDIEVESIEKFNENRRKQDKALNKVIQSEKFIFERITSSMDKITKIKEDFDSINKQIEKHIEENRVLKMEYDIRKFEYKRISELLQEQQKNKEALIYLCNTQMGNDANPIDKGNEGNTNANNLLTKIENNTQSNIDTCSYVKTTTQTGSNLKRRISLNIKPKNSNIALIKSRNAKHQRSNTECGLSPKSPVVLSHITTECSNDILFNYDTNNAHTDIHPNFNNNRKQIFFTSNKSELSMISMRLRELINIANREHLKRLVRNNKKKAKKNSMIQLIKKCIEDISYDYSLLCSTHNTQNKEIKKMIKEKYTKELEVITYIYDNWINMKKEEDDIQMLKSKSCRLRIRKY